MLKPKALIMDVKWLSKTQLMKETEKSNKHRKGGVIYYSIVLKPSSDDPLECI